jgi:hypothetical protein
MKRITYGIYFIVLFLGCTDTTDDGIITNAQDEPVGVQLVFPQENALCNEGTDLTPTQSTIFFEWQPNDNAELYTLTIENLSTNVVSEYETEDFIFSVTIDRATPFRWSVSYNLENEIKESAIWNFYNAGEGIQTYAPFPAQIIAPTMAQSIPATNTVILEWSGSDVDNDILSYDVYFGTNNPPNISASAISANELTVSVTSGTTYFWNVITKDVAGNSSESGVYQFRVLE